MQRSTILSLVVGTPDVSPQSTTFPTILCQTFLLSQTFLVLNRNVTKSFGRDSEQYELSGWENHGGEVQFVREFPDKARDSTCLTLLPPGLTHDGS
jgi:hypothetical protein